MDWEHQNATLTRKNSMRTVLECASSISPLAEKYVCDFLSSLSLCFYEIQFECNSKDLHKTDLLIVKVSATGIFFFGEKLSGGAEQHTPCVAAFATHMCYAISYGRL